MNWNFSWGFCPGLSALFDITTAFQDSWNHYIKPDWIDEHINLYFPWSEKAHRSWYHEKRAHLSIVTIHVWLWFSQKAEKMSTVTHFLSQPKAKDVWAVKEWPMTSKEPVRLGLCVTWKNFHPNCSSRSLVRFALWGHQVSWLLMFCREPSWPLKSAGPHQNICQNWWCRFFADATKSERSYSNARRYCQIENFYFGIVLIFQRQVLFVRMLGYKLADSGDVRYWSTWFHVEIGKDGRLLLYILQSGIYERLRKI